MLPRFRTTASMRSSSLANLNPSRISFKSVCGLSSPSNFWIARSYALPSNCSTMLPVGRITSAELDRSACGSSEKVNRIRLKVSKSSSMCNTFRKPSAPAHKNVNIDFNVLPRLISCSDTMPIGSVMSIRPVQNDVVSHSTKSSLCDSFRYRRYVADAVDPA